MFENFRLALKAVSFVNTFKKTLESLKDNETIDKVKTNIDLIIKGVTGLIETLPEVKDFAQPILEKLIGVFKK